MGRASILKVTGQTPIDIYVADYYGNNKEYLATITGSTIFPVPPTVNYNLPSLFDTAPIIMLILIDANGCEKFELVECTLPFIAIRTETYIPITTETGIILIPES